MTKENQLVTKAAKIVGLPFGHTFLALFDFLTLLRQLVLWPSLTRNRIAVCYEKLVGER